MGKRWDLCVSHKDKGGQWRSQKVGVIFEGDKGQLNVKVDPGIAISTPEGVNITGWLPKEDDGRRGGSRRSNNDDGGGFDAPPPDDTEIPF